MALKPDVTLSIIKNAVANPKATYKLYYDEHVYRTTSSGDGFREIMQTGLECIGNIDIFSECEVIMLAAKSLMSISEDCLLDMSHMRFIEGLLENAGVAPEDMGDFLGLFATKNIPAIKALCQKKEMCECYAEKLAALASMYLPIKDALKFIAPLCEGEKMQAAYSELEKIYGVMECYGLTTKLYIDFSVVNDMNYYDGIIFKGFVNGIPDSVLSGGRYDRLMEKFGKRTEAIGFAVYLDKLERFGNDTDGYDIDVLMVYDSDMPAERIIEAVRLLGDSGKTVRTVNAPETGVRYRQLISLGKEGMKILETND
jgi:ATP phosphoribosyltransferase regulatory subunit